MNEGFPHELLKRSEIPFPILGHKSQRNKSPPLQNLAPVHLPHKLRKPPAGAGLKLRSLQKINFDTIFFLGLKV